MNSSDKKLKGFNLKNTDKIRMFLSDEKAASTEEAPLINENSQPVEVDEDGMEIYYIEDFNEPKEKIVEEDNLEYEQLEGFNDFTEDDEEEEENEDDFEEYEGSEHTLSKLLSNTGEETEEEFDEDYEGSESNIARLGQNIEFEEVDFESDEDDDLEYEEYVKEEEIDDREYEYIEDDEEQIVM